MFEVNSDTLPHFKSSHILIMTTKGLSVLIEQRSGKILCKQISCHVFRLTPNHMDEILFLKLSHKVQPDSNMPHPATCRPGVDIVNSSIGDLVWEYFSD